MAPRDPMILHRTFRSPWRFPLLWRSLAAVLVLAVGGACAKRPAEGAPVSDSTRALLDRYEMVRASLANDDFGSARFEAARLAEKATLAAGSDPTAAGTLKELAAEAQAVAKSEDINKARTAFKSLSATAILLAGNAPGYYIIHCPINPDGDWLQTNTQVSNPYFGRAMPTCGVVKK